MKKDTRKIGKISFLRYVGYKNNNPKVIAKKLRKFGYYARVIRRVVWVSQNPRWFYLLGKGLGCHGQKE
jgi:hypothetical protein